MFALGDYSTYLYTKGRLMVILIINTHKKLTQTWQVVLVIFLVQSANLNMGHTSAITFHAAKCHSHGF